jgi:hypothetical protein
MGRLILYYNSRDRYYIIFLLIVITIPVSGTLMIQQILVPVQVMSGSNVVLRCLFAEIGSNSTPISGNHKHGIITEYDPAAAGPLYSLKVRFISSIEISFASFPYSNYFTLLYIYNTSGIKVRTSFTGIFPERTHRQKSSIGHSLT